MVDIKLRNLIAGYIISDETRISSNDSKHPTLHKNEVETAFGYIQTWPQR